LNRRTRNREGRGFLVFLLKIGAVSALTGVACFELTNWLGLRLGWQTTHQALLVLVIVSSVGLVLTVLLARLLRLRELEDYLKRLARR